MERASIGEYVKPALEVEVGDLTVLTANGERVVAIVSRVFDSHLELSSILYIVNIIMDDDTLGRDRQIRKTKAGFLECFMPDWEPSWIDIDYETL